MRFKDGFFQHNDSTSELGRWSHIPISVGCKFKGTREMFCEIPVTIIVAVAAQLHNNFSQSRIHRLVRVAPNRKTTFRKS